MGAPAGLSEPDLSQEPRPPEGPRARPLPRFWFLGVALGSALLLVWLSRRVFLFWDDFVFLGEAREGDLSWDHLVDPLFRHFSPVVRLVNLAVVGAVPDHPWVLLAVQAALLTAVAGAVTWLMVVLHGRTPAALLGAALLAPSLCLVPLGNWWTAGVNIMPALAGCYVSFGAMVLVLRGASRWWAVPCVLGLVVGVLDYELPMLMPGYLGLWLLLCSEQVTGRPWLASLRRTAWLWVALFAVSGAAAVNYRVNYYDDAAAADPFDIVHASVRSLVRTVVPTLLGFHDPRSGWFSALSLVVGWVALLAVCGWLAWTRVGAWRGLLFAATGWLLPSLALILNRVEIFGVGVVDNVIYFHLPTVLFLVGLLEAHRRPRRVPRVELRPQARRTLMVSAATVLVAAYAWSAGPTARYQLPQGASPDYVETARASLARTRAELGRFTLVNSDVPPQVGPAGFAPYNRVDRVLGVTAGDLTVDVLEPPYVQVDDQGEVRRVDLRWDVEATGAAADALRLRDAEPGSTRTDAGLCFTATEATGVSWVLGGEAPTGPGLVVRVSATVDADTEVRLSVLPDDEDDYARANPDGHDLLAGGVGRLLTVEQDSMRALRLRQFTPGAQVCVQSVAVGHVVPGPA